MILKWNAEQFMTKIEGLTEDALQSAAEMVKDDAKMSMLEPKSGKLPRKKGFILTETIGKQKVQASAPGEAPAVQTGRLYGSIEVVKDQPLSRIIVATDKKAHLLELGTRKMAPRPFLRPALWRQASKILMFLKGKI
jgi:HK97 gp10 family phage protein